MDRDVIRSRYFEKDSVFTVAVPRIKHGRCQRLNCVSASSC